MSTVHSHIDEGIREFILQQKMFFVGSAPLDGEGHVNISPKGLDSFRILGDHKVAYLDLTGSGAETAAHIAENGRIVIMFCAFDGKPDIVRLHGKATHHTLGTQSFDALRPHFGELHSARSIFEIDVTRVADSCGYAVPLYEYQGQRDTLIRYAENKGVEGMRDYRKLKNTTSIDGLPSVGKFIDEVGS